MDIVRKGSGSRDAKGASAGPDVSGDRLQRKETAIKKLGDIVGEMQRKGVGTSDNEVAALVQQLVRCLQSSGANFQSAQAESGKQGREDLEFAVFVHSLPREGWSALLEFARAQGDDIHSLTLPDLPPLGMLPRTYSRAATLEAISCLDTLRTLSMPAGNWDVNLDPLKALRPGLQSVGLRSPSDYPLVIRVPVGIEVHWEPQPGFGSMIKSEVLRIDDNQAIVGTQALANKPYFNKARHQGYEDVHDLLDGKQPLLLQARVTRNWAAQNNALSIQWNAKVDASVPRLVKFRSKLFGGHPVGNPEWKGKLICYQLANQWCIDRMKRTKEAPYSHAPYQDAKHLAAHVVRAAAFEGRPLNGTHAESQNFGEVIADLFHRMKPGEKKVFLLRSASHAMAFELVAKPVREGRPNGFALNFYDPNYNDVHVRTRFNSADGPRGMNLSSQSNYGQYYFGPPGSQFCEIGPFPGLGRIATDREKLSGRYVGEHLASPEYNFFKAGRWINSHDPLWSAAFAGDAVAVRREVERIANAEIGEVQRNASLRGGVNADAPLDVALMMGHKEAALACIEAMRSVPQSNESKASGHFTNWKTFRCWMSAPEPALQARQLDACEAAYRAFATNLEPDQIPLAHIGDVRKTAACMWGVMTSGASPERRHAIVRSMYPDPNKILELLLKGGEIDRDYARKIGGYWKAQMRERPQLWAFGEIRPVFKKLDKVLAQGPVKPVEAVQALPDEAL